MKLKINFFTILILFFVLVLPTCSFADDIYNDDSLSPNIIEVTSSEIETNVPLLNARHAVIYDRASGTVLYGKSENETCKMASTTKILTAIVVLENTNDINTKVHVSRKAATTGRFKIRFIH